jgi:hypothetical protein
VSRHLQQLAHLEDDLADEKLRQRQELQMKLDVQRRRMKEAETQQQQQQQQQPDPPLLSPRADLLARYVSAA